MRFECAEDEGQEVCVSSFEDGTTLIYMDPDGSDVLLSSRDTSRLVRFLSRPSGPWQWSECVDVGDDPLSDGRCHFASWVPFLTCTASSSP